MKYRIAILMFGLSLLPFNAIARGLLDIDLDQLSNQPAVRAGGCPEGRPCPVDERPLDEPHRAIKPYPDYGKAGNGGINPGNVLNNTGQKPLCDNPLFNRNGVEVGCQ